MKTVKTMKKEIEKNTGWKDFPFTWIRKKMNSVKMTILPKVTCRFNVISINIPVPLFTKIYKAIIKFIWKRKRPRIDKTILKVKRENKIQLEASPFQSQ